MKPNRLLYLALIACLLVGNAPSWADSPANQRPNILICVADDWSWPHAGAYGDEVVQTPVFDRIAREGALFEHAFVSSPSCTPSRNAILTGQQFYRLGAGANLYGPLDVKHPNFMSLLGEAGYQIGHWRKAWGPGDYTAGGYTEHPCGDNSSPEEFLENRDESKPFCFWFGSSDPHRPYAKGSGREKGIDSDQIVVPGFFPDSPDIREDMADYYYEVERWDSEVGDVIGLLERDGLLDNTIIVVTSDNGMPFPRCKGNLYDWGSRVPLAIRWGKSLPASRISAFVSLVDLAPTFLELAGLNPPKGMTAHSLVSVLDSSSGNRADRGRSFVVMGRERHVPAQEEPSMVGYPSRAIRTEKWLLILNSESNRWPAGVPDNATHRIGQFADCDGSPTKAVIVSGSAISQLWPYYHLCFEKRPGVELYDCEADPYQIENLADQPDYAGIVRKLKDTLTHYLESTGDPRFSGKPVIFDQYPYSSRIK